MKLQFKIQPYQTEAVQAVVDCFGVRHRQPLVNPERYRIDPGVRKPVAFPVQGTFEGIDTTTRSADSGLRNAELALTNDQVLENINAVQRRTPGLPVSPTLATNAPSTPANTARVNLDIDMETGTGKTYVYIKTIMELHKQYGWSKYIVVVPSVAIREGVKKTFDITADHFKQTYGTSPRFFVYDSDHLDKVEGFSSDAGVQVMIINAQNFNRDAKKAEKDTGTGKEKGLKMFRKLDEFQSRRPIDVIAANRPILIVDEPQKLGRNARNPGETLKALKHFNALFTLNYSATHAIEHDKVYRLDPLDAYTQKLVKKIAVRGISVRGLAGQSKYLYLEGIETGKGTDFPKARIELEVQTKAGTIARQTKRLSQGSRFHDVSKGIEAYRDLYVVRVDAAREIVELSTGEVISTGQVTEDLGEEAKRRIQIREVIRAHLDKERELHPQGIKVLSLFFIDEVGKYRDYTRADLQGEYARVFEEEYEAVRNDHLEQLDLDDAAVQYRAYLERDEPRKVHSGYFSKDKQGRLVDGDIEKTGENAGQSRDVAAYDLILKHKERLLSSEEPVRFIFSHSALREGWDNPNIFTIGFLKKAAPRDSRRQEVGRGLRLAVNEHGERMDHPATVHQINELTVVTDETSADFIRNFHKEMLDAVASRPRKATPEFFAGKIVHDGAAGTEVEITLDQAKHLQYWLVQNGFVDYEQHLTDKWHSRSELPEIPELPAGLHPYYYQVADLIDRLHVELPEPSDGRKSKRIARNEANWGREEFQALWSRINRRAVYQVDFDSDELIRNAVQTLDAQLRVSTLHYVVDSVQQKEEFGKDDLAGQTSFKTTKKEMVASSLSASSTIKYDLVGEIAERTNLTRRTCAEILRKVKPTTFAMFRQNPEQFLSEAGRIIKEQKAAAVIAQIDYDLLNERYDSAVFPAFHVTASLEKAGDKLKKSVYEYVVPDSDGEARFMRNLDISDEVIVYTKLPRGFTIPTPLDDYNPDWAISFREGSVKHVYFVAETKGSLSEMELRPAEKAKIDCAKKFFAKLSTEQVTYDAVTSYDDLMTKVLG